MCSAIYQGGALICAKKRLFFGSKGWSSSLTWFRSWAWFPVQTIWSTPTPSATSRTKSGWFRAKSRCTPTIASMVTSKSVTATASAWSRSTGQFCRTWSATTPTISRKFVAACHNAPGGVSIFETPPFIFLKKEKRHRNYAFIWIHIIIYFL